MIIDLCTTKEYIFIIVTISFAIIEYYLGKTDKTKSGSILELIYNILVAMTRSKK